MQDQQHPRRPTPSSERRLGGGLADYFDVDQTIVRIGFVLLAFFSMGFGAVLVYGLLWAIMPAPDSATPPFRSPSSGAGATGNGALLIGFALVLIGVSMMFQLLHAF